jgi:butyryl-CoA dehydrogenase
MKRAMAGKLGLLPAIKQLMDEVMQPPSFDAGGDTGEALAHETEVLAATRKVALFVAGVASQRYMTALQDQQEVMADLADIIAQVYALESALLRARKLAAAKKPTSKVAAEMTGLLAEETLALAEQAAKRVLAACGEGDMLRTQLAILRRLVKSTPTDTVALSRSVAQACVIADKYPVYGA